MRVVITGASGNVGSAVLRALVAAPQVSGLVGVSRRRPDPVPEGVEWVTGDVRELDLAPILDGADAVIHLAWLIQPARDRRETRSVNVGGTTRVFEAVAAAGVERLLYNSSQAAYAPGGGAGAVTESWPTSGIPTSFYSVDKARAERVLDGVERAHPEMRVVRLRPAPILQPDAAQEIRRYFLGPFLPSPLVRPGRLPVTPLPRSLRIQVVHADDVAAALLATLLDDDARGAYNVAAAPIVTARSLARTLGGVPLPVPFWLVRAVADVTWRLRLQPSPPGWVDLALQMPTMDTGRLRALGWRPAHDAGETLRSFLTALADGRGASTPPLAADAGGPVRLRELLTGVGRR